MMRLLFSFKSLDAYYSKNGEKEIAKVFQIKHFLSKCFLFVFFPIYTITALDQHVHSEFIWGHGATV
jgi:hypothetical protein